MKLWALSIILFFVLHNTAIAQPPNTDFLTYQKSFYRVNEIYNRTIDSLQIQCTQRGISWPVQQVYLRCFKQENTIELWVKDRVNPKFQFFKTYKVCGTNGKLGPKRKEGDKQVPEGFYFINQFNPNSNYHLSLGINYPNVSDRILADAVKPGGDIFIHGDCVSIGCLAINDIQIEEVYILGAIAKSNGQEFVPVHIFPGKFNNSKSRVAIQTMLKDNEGYVPFVMSMQAVYYYFEKERTLPAILINTKGQYVLQDVAIPVEINTSNTRSPIKNINMHKERKYAVGELVSNVDKFPIFNGGTTAYATFLKNLNNELTSYLDDVQRKAFIYTEFVVNTDGTVTNVTITKGGNEIINDVLKTRLEQTTNWTPALKNGVSVPYKMTQTFFIELPNKLAVAK